MHALFGGVLIRLLSVCWPVCGDLVSFERCLAPEAADTAEIECCPPLQSLDPLEFECCFVLATAYSVGLGCWRGLKPAALVGFECCSVPERGDPAEPRLAGLREGRSRWIPVLSRAEGVQS